MGVRDAWKTIRPEEQFLKLVRDVAQLLLDVARLKQSLPSYTRIEGVRLESQMVLGERHVFAVIDDVTATNNGVSYQIVP